MNKELQDILVEAIRAFRTLESSQPDDPEGDFYVRKYSRLAERAQTELNRRENG